MLLLLLIHQAGNKVGADAAVPRRTGHRGAATQCDGSKFWRREEGGGSSCRSPGARAHRCHVCSARWSSGLWLIDWAAVRKKLAGVVDFQRWKHRGPLLTRRPHWWLTGGCCKQTGGCGRQADRILLLLLFFVARITTCHLVDQFINTTIWRRKSGGSLTSSFPPSHRHMEQRWRSSFQIMVTYSRRY